MSVAGTTVNDRYEVGELLGSGPFGRTNAARDLRTGQDVVLKQVAVKGLGGWEPLQLFQREVAALRSLRHPGVPRFIDSFQTDVEGAGPTLVLVMERVPGVSLLEIIERGHRWDEAQARALVGGLLETLSYLHALSPPIIHRDIKPGNVVIRPDGQPVLIDFGGIRDLATRAGHHSMTVVGTAGYMPAEQAMGAAAPASDLFALGATVIHALTHSHPADLPRRNLRLAFQDRVGCSPALTAILARMVEPDIDERYQSAAEVLEDVRRPVQALVPRPQQADARPPRKIAPPQRRALALPPSPRAPTRVATERISGIATANAARGAVGFGMVGAAVTLGSNLHPLAMAVAATLVLVGGSLFHRQAHRRWMALYRDGVAVQGQIISITREEGGRSRYASVEYEYRTPAGEFRGSLDAVDAAADAVDEGTPVLVIHDPGAPGEHIALLKS